MRAVSCITANTAADVAYGSKADMAAQICDACFSPESGHQPRVYDGVDAPDGIDVPKWRC